MSAGPVSGTATSGEGVIVGRIPKLPLAPYAMMSSVLGVHMGMAIKQLRWLEPIWQGTDAVMIVYGWFGARLLGQFGDTKAVYDCIDEHRAAEGVEGSKSRVAHVWEEELQLLKGADLSVCVSAPLAEERAEHAKRLVVLPNAADAEWCRGTFREPQSLLEVPHPRALFMGRITSKIDVELLRAAVAADTGVNWIIVGESVGVPLGGMGPNVRVLGKMHHDDIAAIAVHCDCGVTPLKPTAWNRSSSPMKFSDYLSASLPIVSTRIPAAEELAKELPEAVFIAGGAEEFVRAARAASGVAKEVRERCRQRAETYTWQARARRMLDELAASAPGGGQRS
jgi:glycosyltransferase involved in cell wall biosynthesis